VISPDEMNKYLRTIVVAPMTTSSKRYPTRVSVEHDNRNGWGVVDQIRTIDKQRVVKIFGRLKDPEVIKLKSVIRETYVD